VERSEEEQLEDWRKECEEAGEELRSSTFPRGWCLNRAAQLRYELHLLGCELRLQELRRRRYWERLRQVRYRWKRPAVVEYCQYARRCRGGAAGGLLQEPPPPAAGAAAVAEPPPPRRSRRVSLTPSGRGPPAAVIVVRSSSEEEE
jgi:hypothetical protein